MKDRQSSMDTGTVLNKLVVYTSDQVYGGLNKVNLVQKKEGFNAQMFGPNILVIKYFANVSLTMRMDISGSFLSEQGLFVGCSKMSSSDK